MTDPVIGWYVHHHGHGHLHRALTITRHLPGAVTGLSTLDRPDGWRGDWVRLPPDDGEPVLPDRDPTAGGGLHWVPLRHRGVRARAAALSAWLSVADPDVLVVDVSVEVVLLARLHGVPVVTVAMPGERGDRAHRAAYDASSAILAVWPPAAHGMLHGVGADTRWRVQAVGAVSRYPVNRKRTFEPRTVAVLFGSGGDALPAGWLDRARAATPRWRWTAFGGQDAPWLEDPWRVLRSAEVVVTHAGQNSLAEVAASRRPAVVVPMERPHDEQRTTGRVLRDPRWPVSVVEDVDDVDWEQLLERTARLDGSLWSSWCDGRGPKRAANLIRSVARGRAAASA